MKRAFTLVELLVVIAIIAILAGMLMPALNRARREGQKAKCISNQSNVGKQFIMYRNDNRDRLPSWSQRDGANNRTFYDSSLSLAQLYPDYTETLELFVCPSTDLTVGPDGVDWVMKDEKNNDIDYDDDPTSEDWRFDTDETVNLTNDPSYVMDPNIPVNPWASRAIYADGPDMDLARREWVDRTGKPAADFPAERYANHEYGAVVLFYDGSVEFMDVTGDGRVPSPRLTESQIDCKWLKPLETDIYSDDPFSPPASGSTVCSFRDDTRWDCHLGTYVVYDETKVQSQPWYDSLGQFYYGPDQDVFAAFELDDVND
ncbi:MAG: type II secretion system protein [Candidatus Brocadiia bacterium]